MRVVGGSARGRHLEAPAGARTRPTSDRVREAVFSVLTSLDAIEGARVLDLFAGTGALGIESVSRRAERAVLVDRDGDALSCIRRNLEVLGAERDRVEVVRAEVLDYLRAAPRFDLVFADPPYAFDRWPDLLELLLPRTGLLVAETATGPAPATAAGPDPNRWDPGPGWETVKVKRYGGTLVSIIQPATPKHRAAPS